MANGNKTCFVIMGFGEKTDFQSNPQRVLNLNKTYEYIIEPAVKEAGLTCVRADRIIHSTMIDQSPQHPQVRASRQGHRFRRGPARQRRAQAEDRRACRQERGGQSGLCFSSFAAAREGGYAAAGRPRGGAGGNARARHEKGRTELR